MQTRIFSDVPTSASDMTNRNAILDSIDKSREEHNSTLVDLMGQLSEEGNLEAGKRNADAEMLNRLFSRALTKRFKGRKTVEQLENEGAAGAKHLNELKAEVEQEFTAITGRKITPRE